MKKMLLTIGIVVALFCACFMMGCGHSTNNVDQTNSDSYAMAYAEVEKTYGDADNYQISPKITRDGVVHAYKVVDSDGNYVGQIDVNFD